MKHLELPRLVALAGLALLTPIAVGQSGPTPDGGTQDVQQRPQSPPVAPNQNIKLGENVLLDRVEIVANTDCITLRALDRKVDADQRMTAVSLEEEYLMLRNTIALESVNDLLKRQAGEDLGYDKAMVQARVNDMWEEQVERDGGVTKSTRKLTENSETVLEKREELEGELYASSWTWSVLGREAGPGGRPMFDRFERPGQMRQRYTRMQLTGVGATDALGSVGATPAVYEIQVMLLNPQQFGGMQQAFDKARELGAAFQGDLIDWDDALANFGSADDNIQKPTKEQLLQRFDPGNGALVGFLDQAEVDGISPPMEFRLPMDSRGQRQLVGFAIYKLLGRTAARVPDFAQPGVQKQLRRFMQSQRDQQRYETGLQKLRERAYVWYPGIERERAEAEQAFQERKQEVMEAREENAAAQEAADDAEEQANQPEEAPSESKPTPAEGVDADTGPPEGGSESQGPSESPSQGGAEDGGR